MKDATHGLESFRLKPKGKTGMDLFSHMVAFRKRDGNADANPSLYLDIEMSRQQEEILNPTQHGTALEGALANAGGREAYMKVAEADLFGRDQEL